MFGKKKTLAPLEQDRTQRIVARAIENAREYIETDVAPQRRRRRPSAADAARGW